MKKLYLSAIFLVAFLFVVSAASAAIQLESVTSPSGNPGSSVNVQAVVKNTDITNSVTVVFTSTALVGPGGSITAPIISNLVVPANSNATRTFAVSLPILQSGGYAGTLQVKDSSDASNTAENPYAVTISSVYGLDVTDRDTTSNLLILTGDQGEKLTGTFKVKNIGSEPISDLALSFAQADFKDSDDDLITISHNMPTTLAPGVEVTVTLTADIDSAIDMNTYDGTVTVSSVANSKSDTFTLEVRVQPEVCSDGMRGNIDVEIREPDSGDDFKPGDKISLDVRVNNNENEDLDITVTAFLFDVNNGDNVEEVDSDTLNVNEDDSETFEFDLVVPEDVEAGNEFKLFVKAYEDGNEDEQCDEQSIQLDIKREKNDVIIKSIKISPSTAKAGESVAVEVTVQNIGSNDQNDVVLSLKNPELSIDLDSAAFDLEKFDDDDTQIERFTFTVPDGAETGSYDLEAIADFGSKTVSSFAPIKVEGTVKPAESFASLEVSDVPTSVEAGKSFDLTAKVVNTGDAQATYTVELTNLGSWANSVQAQTITLGAGKTGTLFFTVQTKASATGAQSASVSVLSGNEILDSTDVEVSLGAATTEETSTGINFGSLFTGTTLWIIADILLVIIAIVFIRMLFTSRKKE